MKAEILDSGAIRLTPENKAEVCTIEKVLGLRDDDDSIPLVRVNHFRMNSLCYLQANPPDKQEAENG